MNYVPLNLALMRNPINWVTVTAIAFIGALLLDLITKDASENG